MRERRAGSGGIVPAAVAEINQNRFGRIGAVIKGQRGLGRKRKKMKKMITVGENDNDWTNEKFKTKSLP